MKYYLIVGEASGDLHASHLMTALKAEDPQADFRFFGGDLMAAVGGTMVKHYKELAYMGFIPVLLHLRTIFANMKRCKEDIVGWNPDVVILVDYPGFNLNIAKFVHARTQIPVFYYISPKIWAWKEYRIKNIKRDVDELFSILPFEVEFFEAKHQYPIHYVGNPTVDEVTAYQKAHPQNMEAFIADNKLEDRPVIALLAGSRKQEIKDNLPDMLKAASAFPAYQLVLAGAPGIAPEYYEQYVGQAKVKIIFDQTYRLLQHAEAALFGTQIAVKKVTIKVTATSGGTNLAEISKVEFVNDMESRIPAPQMDIPQNLQVQTGSKTFTVTWDPAVNVTGVLGMPKPAPRFR